jgi:hypothetical protein
MGCVYNYLLTHTVTNLNPQVAIVQVILLVFFAARLSNRMTDVLVFPGVQKVRNFMMRIQPHPDT